MRVLNIEPATNFSGGVNQLIINVNGLIRKGHEIFVACVFDSPVHRALKDKKVGFVFIDEHKIFSSAGIVRSFLKEHRIDIVHTHHSKGHTIGLLALIGRKKEKLVVQRSVLFPAMNAFKYLNPRVDLFIVNSKAAGEVLARYFVSPKKIKVVYSAIDENRLKEVNRIQSRSLLDFDGIIFGMVGNYSSYKGHDIALEAFMRANIKNSILVVVGKGTRKLYSKAVEFGIEDRVKILGFREEAFRIIAGFDVLVIPSLKESFPNVVIEAFLLKVPVIGTKVGGIVELLDKDRGLLAEPDAFSISEKMRQILKLNKYEMIENAYNFALKNLTATKKVEKLEQVYMEISS